MQKGQNCHNRFQKRFCLGMFMQYFKTTHFCGILPFATRPAFWNVTNFYQWLLQYLQTWVVREVRDTNIFQLYFSKLSRIVGNPRFLVMDWIVSFSRWMKWFFIQRKLNFQSLVDAWRLLPMSYTCTTDDLFFFYFFLCWEFYNLTIVKIYIKAHR